MLFPRSMTTGVSRPGFCDRNARFRMVGAVMAARGRSVALLWCTIALVVVLASGAGHRRTRVCPRGGDLLAHDSDGIPVVDLGILTAHRGNSTAGGAPGLLQSHWERREHGAGQDAVENLLSAWDCALQTYGFVTITNHGVPKAAITDLYSASKAFFSLDLEEKMHACPSLEYGGHNGFTPQGIESVGRSTGTADEEAAPPDLVRSLFVPPGPLPVV